jgi:hypothetical protein
MPWAFQTLPIFLEFSQEMRVSPPRYFDLKFKCSTQVKELNWLAMNG